MTDTLNNTVNCLHCGKSWDKTLLSRSCSNCFACTGCEAYICPECRYETVITPPRPMKWNQKE
ncbi:MAG TPA: hypothetical protein VFC65_16035 [Prolixibacteraceae bacterium]|nr:hypothetical protein [Prolixibacteraceae bacterium]